MHNIKAKVWFDFGNLHWSSGFQTYTSVIVNYMSNRLFWSTIIPQLENLSELKDNSHPKKKKKKIAILNSPLSVPVYSVNYLTHAGII